MFNRKCSRCKEITNGFDGGKKIGEEFLCADCLEKTIEPCSRCTETTSISNGRKVGTEFLCKNCEDKAIETGEIQPLSQETTYLSIATLKWMSVVYLVVSILTTLSAADTMSSGMPDGMTVYSNGPVGMILIGALFQTILIFCVIRVFILLVETVLKIYEKIK